MTALENYVLPLTATLGQAVECLSNNSLHIVVVVDEEDRLAGTITDGDIRRALLASNDFDTGLDAIMNSEPIALLVGTDQAIIREQMKEHAIQQIPLIDEERRILGLSHINDFLGVRTLENAVLLMAGGFGKRLLPLTEDTPKPMLKIGDVPMLEIIIRQLIDAGFRKFFISVHYRADVIISHFGDGASLGISIEYLHENSPLGTAGALALLPQISEPILVMNGDILSRVDFYELLQFHKKSGVLVTMVVRDYEHNIPFAVIEHEGPFVKGLIEKPTISHFINAGIYMLSPQVCNAQQKPEYTDMPDLLNSLIDQDDQVAMFPLHEYWSDVGQIEEFEQAHSRFKN